MRVTGSAQRNLWRNTADTPKSPISEVFKRTRVDTQIQSCLIIYLVINFFFFNKVNLTYPALVSLLVFC